MMFTIEIASVSDRDELVAEIWQSDQMIAEIRRAIDGEPLIEIYSPLRGGSWTFVASEWLEAQNRALARLDGSIRG